MIKIPIVVYEMKKSQKITITAVNNSNNSDGKSEASQIHQLIILDRSQRSNELTIAILMIKDAIVMLSSREKLMIQIQIVE